MPEGITPFKTLKLTVLRRFQHIRFIISDLYIKSYMCGRIRLYWRFNYRTWISFMNEYLFRGNCKLWARVSSFDVSIAIITHCLIHAMAYFCSPHKKYIQACVKPQIWFNGVFSSWNLSIHGTPEAALSMHCFFIFQVMHTDNMLENQQSIRSCTLVSHLSVLVNLSPSRFVTNSVYLKLRYA